MQLSKSFSAHFSAMVKPSDRVLVAVSGGLDSVVLLDLLAKYGVNDLAVVHCNFQLRGKDSDEDEKFVQQLARSYGLKFFCKRFDTPSEQKQSKQSIQMTARDLRYAYFSELLKKEKYDYVAVAHHADDQIETFFINLLRSSGIKGLRGMRPKREQIIRPLLKFSKQDLATYALKHNLQHREDASNAKDYYLRNSIRHHLIPCLETLDKSAKKSILQTIENLQDLENQSLQELDTLQNCGFSATQIRDIQKTIGKQSGKQFTSKTHRATTHNGQMIIEPRSAKALPSSDYHSRLNLLKYNDGGTTAAEQGICKIDIINIEDFVLKTDPHTAQLDFDKLKFPLTLRHWQVGDFFIPFGQRGKQKLSDFFVNQKLSCFEKERVWLLCSGEDIVWVVGYRIDNRYRISSRTKRVLVVETVLSFHNCAR